MLPRMPQSGARFAAPCALLFLSFAAASAGEGPAPLPRKTIPSDSRWRSAPPRWDFWNPTRGEPEWGQRIADAKEMEQNTTRVKHFDLGPSFFNSDNAKKFLLAKTGTNQEPPLPWLEDDLLSAPEVGLGIPAATQFNANGRVKGSPQIQIAHDLIAVENTKGVDRFAKMLFRRTDLEGLPVRLAPDCRLSKPAGERLDQAATLVHQHFESSLGGNKDEARSEWSQYERAMSKLPHESHPIRVAARIAALIQIMEPESEELRRGLIRHLKGLAHPEAARAIAKLAIFSEEPALRLEATKALQSRPGSQFDEIIRLGLRYPRPEIAVRTMDLIVKTKRIDWADAIIDLLEEPDPRAPTAVNNGKSYVVRELVRIRHHDNCMLCHPPAQRGAFANDLTLFNTNLWSEFMATPRKQIPTGEPNQGIGGWGGFRGNRSGFQEGPSVRFDVTFLRPDFSLNLSGDAVQNGVATNVGGETERFDFVVRTRKLTPAQAREYQKELARDSGERSPYRTIALSALRQLTKQDVEPTAEAWRAVLAELR